MTEPAGAQPKEDFQAHRLKRYFANYPGRDSRWAHMLFRRGEEARFRQLQSWLPDWNGLTVLDAGCGDGVFLSRLMSGRPRLLRLEDLVEKWTRAAGDRLREAADSVEAVTTDVRSVDDRTQYDIVLALGIFDYSSDWPGLLQCLLARTNTTIVVDFPRSGTLHSVLRRLWLRLQGVRLYPARRWHLEQLFETAGVDPQIKRLPLQWLALIDTRPGTG